MENVKIAQTLNKVLKVFYYAGMITLVLVLLMAVFSLLGPDHYFQPERFSGSRFTFELNGIVRFKLDSAQLGDGGSIRSVFLSIAAAAGVYALVFLYLLRRLREVVATVADRSPFQRDNPKRIRALGLGVTAAAFLIPAANSLVAWRMISSFNLDGFSVLYTPDLKLMFAGLLLLILAAVFDYGCYLQEEMDQTV
ncbi:MAG: DUF2975 domain-containing protein [Firmicutes bacterium]|nr:DUF2975 domain-containing protein [Bacillota bacterium]